MKSRRQFSVGYLMLEMFWIALACALTRLTILWIQARMLDVNLAFIAAMVCWTTALGGALGSMKVGFLVGLAIGLCFIVAMPSFRM